MCTNILVMVFLDVSRCVTMFHKFYFYYVRQNSRFLIGNIALRIRDNSGNEICNIIHHAYVIDA